MTFWEDAPRLPARPRRARRRRRGRVVVGAAVLAALGGLVTLTPEARVRLRALGAGDARPTAGRPVPPAPGASARSPGRTRRAGPRPRWRVTMASQPQALHLDELGVVAAGATEVVAVDARRGRRLWNAPLDGGVGTLAADEESVVVATRDRFVVLERRSGERRFEVPTPDEPGPAVILRPRSGPGMLVLTTRQGGVAGLDPATGAAAWGLRPGGRLRGLPAIDHRRATVLVVLETDHDTRLVAVDLRLGRSRWERRLPPWTSSPTVHDDLVIVGAGDGDRRAAVRAFALDDGTSRWRAAVPASFQEDIVPEVAGGRVFIADQLGTLSALDAATGARRWRARLPGAVLAGRPAVAPPAVLVTSFSDELRSVAVADGRLLARWRTPGLVVGVAVRDDTVVLAQRLVAADHLSGFAAAAVTGGPRGGRGPDRYTAR